MGREGRSVSKAVFLRHRKEHEDLIPDILRIAYGVEEAAKRAQILLLAGGKRPAPTEPGGETVARRAGRGETLF